MNDLISRQAAIEAFYCTDELIVGGEANARNVVNYINKVVGKIENLPSAQPMRKRGKWEIYVISMLDGEGCRCSECGFEGTPYWDFCPNCGSYNGGDADEPI